MTVFAIELNDRTVSLARGGHVLSSAPSAVFNGNGTSPAGANAWRELRSQPMATSSRHLGAVLTQRIPSARAEMLLAAELKARMAEQPIRDGERIWIATPAQAESTGLEALLGIVRRLGGNDILLRRQLVPRAIATEQLHVLLGLEDGRLHGVGLGPRRRALG